MAIDPQDAFIADLNGVFAQHSSMWTIYNESIKLLVTVSALPLLAAAALLAAGERVDFTTLPPLLVCTLVVTPVLVFVTLGVVIHYRLTVLWYARGLNGFRAIYFSALQSAEATIQPPMPTDPRYPANYEFTGPMGLIVHGSAVLNAGYLFLAGSSFGGWLPGSIVALVCVAALELWYWWNCHRYP